MNATISSQATVSPVDALWSLFMSQSKKVKKEFTKRLMSEELSPVSPALAKKIAEARKEYEKGETKHFETVEEMQHYFDNL